MLSKLFHVIDKIPGSVLLNACMWRTPPCTPLSTDPIISHLLLFKHLEKRMAVENNSSILLQMVNSSSSSRIFPRILNKPHPYQAKGGDSYKEN
jgi:hypothetical protein